jgi:hypothetical protein
MRSPPTILPEKKATFGVPIGAVSAAPRSRTRPSSIALVVIVALGGLVRVWGLGAPRLGFDEAFTAMAGRKPLGSLFAYLRVRDSHPPLDYLLRAPLARAGASELVFRLPSVICSVAALAVFAWWMRRRGVAGVVATALLAASAFQITFGREARMYAELELIGVVVAVMAEAWLHEPRSWHAPAIGALSFVGLMTHVSMFLLVAGLALLAGLRRDRDAWRWRAALLAALVGWAVLWGPTFLVQSRGGHSSWIPRTTVDGLIRTFGALVTPRASLQLAAVAAVVAGSVLVWQSRTRLSRVFVCCALAPAVLASLAGLVAPVLLDRTMTLWSWGPCMAFGFLVAHLLHRSRVLGVVALMTAAVLLLPSAVDTVTASSNVDLAVRRIEAVARPGDVIASRPGNRLHLLLWSVSVRRHEPARGVRLAGLGNSLGVAVGDGPLTGRTWLLESNGPIHETGKPRCARDRTFGALHVVCWRDAVDQRSRSSVRGALAARRTVMAAATATAAVTAAATVAR